MRRPLDHRRGMTLVETMVSVVVLTIGVASIFNLLGHVSSGHRSLALTGNGLDLYSRLSAEIRDAHCDFQATDPPSAFSIDPGLAAVPPNTWVDDLAPPPASSTIQAFGLSTDLSPQVRVSYRVRPVGAFTGGRAATQLLAYEVDIRVREITNDPARDAAAREEGFWIKMFTVEKLCNGRVDPPTAAQSGRGEFVP
ncbi:MAG: prepilin-type N-terminal cleavage/methylation domain-containing protein [Deltaproteobacteria bacterium]|nr:prepilin-type N-terminal cleavage/methylation domain-containing protein [Deltaproteobacteria bacterium]